jgi:hypothetical protein
MFVNKLENNKKYQSLVCLFLVGPVHSNICILTSFAMDTYVQVIILSLTFLVNESQKSQNSTQIQCENWKNIASTMRLGSRRSATKIEQYTTCPGLRPLPLLALPLLHLHHRRRPPPPPHSNPLPLRVSH